MESLVFSQGRLTTARFYFSEAGLRLSPSALGNFARQSEDVSPSRVSAFRGDSFVAFSMMRGSLEGFFEKKCGGSPASRVLL